MTNIAALRPAAGFDVTALPPDCFQSIVDPLGPEPQRQGRVREGYASPTLRGSLFG